MKKIIKVESGIVSNGYGGKNKYFTKMMWLSNTPKLLSEII